MVTEKYNCDICGIEVEEKDELDLFHLEWSCNSGDSFSINEVCFNCRSDLKNAVDDVLLQKKRHERGKMIFKWIENTHGRNSTPYPKGEVHYYTYLGGIYEGEIIVAPADMSGQQIEAIVYVNHNIFTGYATCLGGDHLDKPWDVNEAMNYVEQKLIVLLNELGFSHTATGRVVRSCVEGGTILYKGPSKEKE